MLTESDIIAKYPEEIANKLILTNNVIAKTIQDNNDKFAIKIEHYHYITKNKEEATSLVHLDKNAEPGVKIVKEIKDPNETHKYTTKTCNEEINKRLKKAGINLTFNRYHFNLFNKYYGIKQNEKLCYTHRVHTQPTYSYSFQTIEFIVDEIKKDPENIIQNLKEKITKK